MNYHHRPLPVVRAIWLASTMLLLIHGESAFADPGDAGWFRTDIDSGGLQVWYGRSHELGDMTIESDIYLAGTFAEVDVGPSLAIGPWSISLLAGLGMDFALEDFESIIAPQLITILDHEVIYVESWTYFTWRSLFTDGGTNELYARNFALLAITDWLRFGPQIELTTDLSGDSGVTSLPFGARVNINYTANDTLGIFLGWDFDDRGGANGGDALAGRFTFIHYW